MKTTPAKGIAYAESTDLMRDYPTAVSKPAAETIDAALRAQDSFNTETRNVVVNKVASEWLPNQANITTHASTPFHARTGPVAQTGADLNQLTEPGLYHLANGNANAPSGVFRNFDGTLEVITHGTVVVQRLTSISTAVVAGRRTSAGESEGLVFHRARTNGVWRRWQHTGGATVWHTHGISLINGFTSTDVAWRLSNGKIEFDGGLFNSSHTGTAIAATLVGDLAPIGSNQWAVATSNTAVLSVVEVIGTSLKIHTFGGTTGTRRPLSTLSYPAKI